MSKKSYEDYDYEEDYDDEKRGYRRLRRDSEPVQEKKKKWERESFYDRDHDYDERR